MQPILKFSKLSFFAIVSIISMVVYFFNKDDRSQSTSASSQLRDPPQALVKDPFKEFLAKEQQGAAIQANQVKTSPPTQIVNGNSTTTVPAGTDPFKAFLEAESKAKPEEAAISPFSSVK